MSFTKNQLIDLEIEALSSDGSGVGHYDGQAIFVPGTAPGDVGTVRVTKALKAYAFGRLEQLRSPGPGRCAPDCAAYGPCGGCDLRHMTYAAECDAKTGFVRDAFTRLGGFSLPVAPVLPAPVEERYRNKVQLPVGRDAEGHIVTGFYARRSHRIIPNPDCRLQPAWMNELAASACALFEQNGVEPYDEEKHTGLVRHLYLRQGWHTGQRLLCFVVNGKVFAQEEAIAAALQAEFELTTVLHNTNPARTNVILGEKTRTLLGPGTIEDRLAGVPLRMGVHEFYQVNTPAAEVLYATARHFAHLRPQDFLLDLYCGMGSIGLSMKADCKRLLGVEIIPQAVQEAKATAAAIGLTGEQADFLCMDAGAAATKLAGDGQKPDVIVIDPPRKGCDAPTLAALVAMSPRTIVMVSCNAATAARDAKTLCEASYHIAAIQPVDLFPRTKHVETVVLLSQRKPDDTIVIDLDLDELDATSAETKATYDEIKAHVLKENGLKVSSLYISQVKRKCGLEVGENYNLAKKEGSRIPQCPPDKEKAIHAALEYFAML